MIDDFDWLFTTMMVSTVDNMELFPTGMDAAQHPPTSCKNIRQKVRCHTYQHTLEFNEEIC